MASRSSPTKVVHRKPLGDATGRLNTIGAESAGSDHYYRSRSGSKTGRGRSPTPVKHQLRSKQLPRPSAADPQAADRRVSTISQESHDTIQSRRASKASSASSTTKTHIGPWQLGKTLGKGSSARVRAARHSVTQQTVAVKIIAKRTAQITQAGSIAKLDLVDSTQPENPTGVRRMPLAIEREVAILKLIEHPNIIKLYDIWENRNEIYLVLEFVEHGDLFEFINKNGPLTEEQAIFVFRQLMSAIDYCHSYNICHRDLKPENILLKADGQVKIADFGMAALHQGPNHQLRTACGSPHYAAPELLRLHNYRGDKADIWSLGVILFAMLAARLPFNDENLSVMLAKVRKGIYDMPAHFSREAKDLIHRILQTDPSIRISMKEMWQHPLVWKYGYLDDLGGNKGQPPDVRMGKQRTPLDLAHIDDQIFRQLRSMWHALPEKDLAAKLISNDPNDQKLFYWLLHSYQERQLENYNPSLTYSASDRHLLKPTNWSTRVSSRQFSQPKASGHGRNISRFTVISSVDNELRSEIGTVRSYDPYKSSLVMRPSKVSHAKITIHRDGPEETELRSAVGSQSSQTRAGSVAGRRRLYSMRSGTTGRLYSPRGSMSSLRSNRQATPRVRASSRHKRGVNFSSIRKRPSDLHRHSLEGGSQDAATMAGREPMRERDTASPSSLHVEAPSTGHKLAGPGRPAAGAKDHKISWHEDLRHFSSSIAKDCDEAFKGSFLSMDTTDQDIDGSLASPFSLLTLGTPRAAGTPATTPTTATQTGMRPWDQRPLPPPPPGEPMGEDAEPVQYGRSRDPYTTPAPNRVQKPMFQEKRHGVVNGPPAEAGERRIVSAPVYAQYSRNPRQLPSIYEASPENWKKGGQDEKARVVSAPPKSPAGLPTPHENRGLQFLAKADNTIRVVTSPSRCETASGVAVPLPLKLRRKFSPKTELPATAVDLRERYKTSGQPTQDDISPPSQGGNDKALTPKKKRSWFRRSSKSEGQMLAEQAGRSHASVAAASQPTRNESLSTDSGPPPPPGAKRGFAFSFWKSSKSNPKLSLADADYSDNESLERSGLSAKKRGRAPSVYEDEDSGVRKIEPQQNWLARLFRVKPATRYICLHISKRRARQEVAILLREWRKYGIKDIEVDKDRNIVFARVSAYNYLSMKEVTFACEIMTVIEHGKRNHLSIVRFTQEKGAASSFHKVVDTMTSVFGSRHLLVAEKRKAKMMIKTLNS